MGHCGGLKFWKKDNGKVGAEKFGQFFVQILNQLMNLGTYSCTLLFAFAISFHAFHLSDSIWNISGLAHKQGDTF
jgi:ubiquinone biosynthesis protein COQ9